MIKDSVRKYAVLFLTAAAAVCLSACGQKEAQDGNTKGEAADKADQISIVATSFPEYDGVRTIVGEDDAHVKLRLLLDNGVDIHSYQPSVADIMEISSCDLFIYTGGVSETWVDGALKEAVNKEMKVINMMDVLGDAVKTEEIVEGMQDTEHDHDHDHDHEHSHEDEGDHEHEEAKDEHVWLSLKNAKVLTDEIADALAELDAEHAETYRQNQEAYAEKLDALDAEYQETVDAAAQNTILFGDRFPFRYLVDDYELNYYAAFDGCSAETEASFETITFLAKKVDELGLNAVLTVEKSDEKIAKTVIANTKEKDQAVLQMNSIQSTTTKDAEQGATYLSIMEDNLNVLREALQ